MVLTLLVLSPTTSLSHHLSPPQPIFRHPSSDTHLLSPFCPVAHNLSVPSPLSPTTYLPSPFCPVVFLSCHLFIPPPLFRSLSLSSHRHSPLTVSLLSPSLSTCHPNLSITPLIPSFPFFCHSPLLVTPLFPSLPTCCHSPLSVTSLFTSLPSRRRSSIIVKLRH